MDKTIVLYVKYALQMIGINHVTVTTIDNQNQIWIRDDRIQIGARWCIVEGNGPILTIKNGRHFPEKIDLADPNSMKILATAIDDALTTTKMFLKNEDECEDTN